MRKWQILAYILVFVIVSGEATAGDREDVLTKMAIQYAAWNSGNAEAISFNSHSRYNVEGGLLETIDPEKMIAWAKDAFATGLKINVQTSQEDVSIYGNTAVFTCYEKVRIDPPEGQPFSDSRRVTIVLVKQNGEWNEVHAHLSYLKPGNIK